MKAALLLGGCLRMTLTLQATRLDNGELRLDAPGAVNPPGGGTLEENDGAHQVTFDYNPDFDGHTASCFTFGAPASRSARAARAAYF